MRFFADYPIRLLNLERYALTACLNDLVIFTGMRAGIQFGGLRTDSNLIREYQCFSM
jgi:hypothetical protein